MGVVAREKACFWPGIPHDRRRKLGLDRGLAHQRQRNYMINQSLSLLVRRSAFAILAPAAEDEGRQKARGISAGKVPLRFRLGERGELVQRGPSAREEAGEGHRRRAPVAVMRYRPFALMEIGNVSGPEGGTSRDGGRAPSASTVSMPSRCNRPVRAASGHAAQALPRRARTSRRLIAVRTQAQ